MSGKKNLINKLDENNIDNSEYNSLSRQIIKNKNYLNLKSLKIAFFSNYTIEILEPYLMVELAKKGYFLNASYNSYGMIENNVFNAESNIYQNKFDIFFIDLKFEDIFPDFNNYQFNLTEKKAEDLVLSFSNYMISLLDSIRNNFKSNVLISNFTSSADKIESSLMNSLKISRYDLIYRINNTLKKIVSDYPQNFIHDFYTFSLNYGFKNFLDVKMSYLADVPIKMEYQSKLSYSFSNTIFSVLQVPKKCLVCDLDNTLWGGILGEDGYESIQLGDSFPGNIYKDFQKTILNLREIGIFIAIASKNNKDEVINFMKNNKDCLIKINQISVLKVNWKDKANNIREIASELNIGLDSIVFFDDSKHEREWVKSQLPEVNVIEVPINPVDYKKALIESNYFNKFSLSKEDKIRPNLFEIDKKRISSKHKFKNINDYIISLKIKILLSPLKAKNITRAVQLIKKTNQFNLTTKRYNENDLLLLQKKKFEIFTIRIIDKYGDSGLTGVLILEPLRNRIWKIDTFLLSCRVLGRNIEKVILNFISKKLLNIDAKEIVGEFIPTKKNIIAKDFYNNLKFKKKSPNLWVWELKNGIIFDNNLCEIEEEYE